jgi:hypothetical protein
VFTDTSAQRAEAGNWIPSVGERRRSLSSTSTPAFRISLTSASSQTVRPDGRGPPIATRIGVESMVSARTTYARRFRAPNRTQSKLALSFPGEAPVKKLKVGQGAVFTALRGVTAWRFILEADQRGQRLALFFRSPRAWGRGFFSVRPPASDGSTRR